MADRIYNGFIAVACCLFWPAVIFAVCVEDGTALKLMTPPKAYVIDPTVLDWALWDTFRVQEDGQHLPMELEPGDVFCVRVD